MPDLNRDAQLADDPYYRLAADTFVTLFWRQHLLEETLDRLRSHHYAVVVLDASQWTTEEDFHQDISATLDFPSYYGRNLDALNDCLRDVVAGDYGTPEGAAGIVLAFTHYDQFTRACPSAAQIVLDIIAIRARSAAIHARRVLCLVHSNDPHITFEPVGATAVMWNQAEWLNSRRGPHSPDS
ncbi:hypothetical protein ABIA33_002991 [Streptacidiphilus sp. MAP12-16]|uniref:barstar family protein n=1 Tax=Streptacidiphilus sp. MAP12-16 TaxID=3156300 RepID=UPI0035158A32